MKTMRKTAILFMLICCLLALALAGCSNKNGDLPVYQGSGTKETVLTTRIVTMEGEKLFDGDVKVVDDNPTAYMALQAAANSAGLKLGVSNADTPDQMFLDSIGDLAGANPNFWMIYIDKESTSSGMGTQTIAGGQVLEFLFGDYNKGYVEIK